MIHILHLCSYYIGSSVYRDLVTHLAEESEVASQFLFIPVRDHRHLSKNTINKKNVSLLYKKCLNLFTRIFYSYKQIRIILSFFMARQAREYLYESTIIHAHTLYSDGFLAYLLNKIYKKPYVITVRGTDVNLAHQAFIHWRPLARAILRNARKVIFVSPGHYSFIRENYKQLPNTLVVPNGVDQYWITHALERKSPRDQGTIKAVYVGGITKNKNIKSAIEALHTVADGRPYRFVILGGTSEEYTRVYGALPPTWKSNVEFKRFTTKKEELAHAFHDADVFLMPSFSETFGLTYIEAISQGTPVVYAEKQGIDGYFQSGMVGFPCDPNSTASIGDAIRKTLAKFPGGLSFPTVRDNPVHRFSWSYVASQLINSSYKLDTNT